MYQYLTPTVVQEFIRKYPDANMFLIRESLRGELNALLNTSNPNEYQRRRLADLQRLEESNRKIMKGEMQ